MANNKLYYVDNVGPDRGLFLRSRKSLNTFRVRLVQKHDQTPKHIIKNNDLVSLCFAATHYLNYSPLIKQEYKNSKDEVEIKMCPYKDHELKYDTMFKVFYFKQQATIILETVIEGIGIKRTRSERKYLTYNPETEKLVLSSVPYFFAVEVDSEGYLTEFHQFRIKVDSDKYLSCEPRELIYNQ